MNYIKIYNNLIDFRLKNPPIEYFEKHHIKPRSLFPELEKDSNNIVKLTYKEHYLAHHLLYRYYKSIGNKNAVSKMALAWFMTCYRENGLKVTALQFEKAKIAMKSRPISEETRNKIILAAKKRGKSLEYREKQSKIQKLIQSGINNGFYGKHHSEETRKKLSEARKGKPAWNSGKHNIYSEETIKRISESQRGQLSKVYGTIWISNEIETIRIKSNYLEQYLNLGYIKGRKKKAIKTF